MKLQDSYSAIIKMYLTKYNQVKIHIDDNGKIVKTEKEKKGVWLIDRNLCKILNNLSLASFNY